MIANIESDVDLSNANTLAVPGRAEYFCSCSSIEELRAALSWATQNNQLVSVLGGGSNTLLKERTSGLVIQPNFLGMETSKVDEHSVKVSVGAGEQWHKFVRVAAENAWYGLENLALIPGTVGAAPIQNIGAYGVEVADMIASVDCINLQTGELVCFNKKDCDFSYRESMFKTREGKAYLIYRVSFLLKREFTPVLNYPALKAVFAKRAPKTAMELVEAVETIRTEKLPDPDRIPNAGSFFKNPLVSLTDYESLKQSYPDIVAFDTNNKQKKLAAAWLIDQCGWKERALNDVKVHENQALVIVNPKRKSLEDIMALASAIQADVNTRFGVTLEIEPQLLRSLKLG